MPGRWLPPGRPGSSAPGGAMVITCAWSWSPFWRPSTSTGVPPPQFGPRLLELDPLGTTPKDGIGRDRHDDEAPGSVAHQQLPLLGVTLDDAADDRWRDRAVRHRRADAVDRARPGDARLIAGRHDAEADPGEQRPGRQHPSQEREPGRGARAAALGGRRRWHGCVVQRHRGRSTLMTDAARCPQRRGASGRGCRSRSARSRPG